MLLWTGNPELTSHVVALLPVLAFGTLLNGLMWMPYQLQLAYGWTSLMVKVNAVAVAVLVPAIVVVAPRYGGLGAAWVWVVLNAGYVAFVIYFMHRRILPMERWAWYTNDTLSPLAVAAAVAIACRWMIPQSPGKVSEGIALSLISCIVLCAAGVGAPLIRSEVGRYLTIELK